MMRNNDFDALVSAKQTLRSKIIIKPSKSSTTFDLSVMPPDEACDDKYHPDAA